MFRVKSPQDFGAAVVFMLIGLAGIYFGKDLTFGSASRMGPGYFPTIISFLILGLGVVIGLRSIAVEGPPIEALQFRPLIFVIGSILVFGILIDRVGLAISAVTLTLVAGYARRSVDLRETFALGAGLAIFSIVVFVYALGQPLPAWWGR
jgi:hypothetical protein